ncbi:MAG TPA: acyl-CoA dehydrogenase family protein [Thermodesulfobacteriota bacterium]|nr:acyl-CoA dehydrogenase family protein [Thermodesulfobacteriota bacterium]
MMDLMLSAQEKDFKEYCRKFAREKVIPIAEKYGETDEIPEELVNAMANAGFFQLFLPEDLGGRGVRALPVCLAREELAGVYCPADVTLAMQGLGSYPIFLAGSRDQKEKFLGKIGSGEWLTTYALTEPEAGSDVNGMRSRAKEQSEGFVLNGSKRFISNGYAADILVAFAKTPLEGNPKAMSAFVLEKGIPGLVVSKRLRAMAPHDLVELEFNDCFVPRENLLGKVGEGFKIAMKTLDVFRMSVGAAAVGIGQAAFDAALDYSKKRVQFGSSIAKFQAIQLKLAEMATELDAARALVYRAAILKDRGDSNVSRFASMAKFYATETGFRAVDQSLQIHGGIGVIQGSLVERLYREVRALRIYEGTSEIQKLIIANSLLKE